jgi:DNA topoisomerase-3
VKPEDFQSNGRFQVGRVLRAASAKYEAKSTEPPKRFTQSDLIDEMMAAYKYTSNDGERALLRQIAGLGTSRTREAVITGLLKRGFLIEEKSRRARTRTEIKPSETAMTIVRHLPKLVTDPATTAKWEFAFQLLEQGKVVPQDLRKFFVVVLNDVVSQAKSGGQLSLPQAKAPVAPQYGKAQAGKDGKGAKTVVAATGSPKK